MNLYAFYVEFFYKSRPGAPFGYKLGGTLAAHYSGAWANVRAWLEEQNLQLFKVRIFDVSHLAQQWIEIKATEAGKG
jgi:hypothetical protein